MEKHEHKDGCGCGHEHEDGCGCCHEHEDGCGCGHEHKDGCGCCHEHEDGCGCGHEHKHEEHCSCGCSCGHDHGNDEAAKAEIPRLLLALALFAAGLLLPSLAGKALLLACYLVSGYDVLRSAFRSLGRGRMLDENFLMAVASLAAIAIGELTEGCA
ncbi:MAG: hypothetical protein IJB18_03500, partial [Clostridia bacterium]|nr:hypothetical protein [Clostridia bacterium]